jgi:hypothetical protein
MMGQGGRCNCRWEVGYIGKAGGFEKIGAGEGNRTLVISLGNYGG